MSQERRVELLRDRAAMLRAARHFFDERGVCEVDCPIVSKRASIDLHIDLLEVRGAFEGVRYLHSSPEYGMKRLLAEGMGDIYQISHVFRDGEVGEQHNPEFTLVEWYRLGFSFEQMIQETLDFIQLFVGSYPTEQLTYRQAMERYAGLDYLTADEAALLDYLEGRGIAYCETGKMALLNQVLASAVEPHLGDGKLTVISHYPAEQAALSQTVELEGGEEVALRFEVYYKGRELANGYVELIDPEEQRCRFEKSNRQRQLAGKGALPIDTCFLSALERGVPPCCGVAVGFDRLMMVRNRCAAIADVLPFSWEEA